jgi:hypothetical protein
MVEFGTSGVKPVASATRTLFGKYMYSMEHTFPTDVVRITGSIHIRGYKILV